MRTVANVLASGNGIQLALGEKAAGAGTVTVGQSQGLDLAHAEEHVGLSAGLGGLMVHDSSEASDLSAESANCVLEPTTHGSCWFGFFLTAQRGVAALAEPMEARVTATVERKAETFMLAVDAQET
jgi:hypothetical protein